MSAEGRLDADLRYLNGVREAVEIVKSTADREDAANRLLQIADGLRKDDPKFLYREFFVDVRVDDWDEFSRPVEEPADG